MEKSTVKKLITSVYNENLTKKTRAVVVDKHDEGFFTVAVIYGNSLQMARYTIINNHVHSVQGETNIYVVERLDEELKKY
jgi:hypothetical protein